MRRVKVLAIVLPSAVAATALALVVEGATAEATPAPRRAAVTCRDADGDGFGLDCAAGLDCNDRDATVHPGASEPCDFRDHDCDGLVDDGPGCAAPPVEAGRVAIPPGPFVRGSLDGAADERPVREVEISAFALDRYEVTNGRYAACVREGACTAPHLASSHRRRQYYGDARFDDYPVIFVTWHQADAFCRHVGGRLPREAEWEKAARGGAGSRRTFPWGDEAPDCRRANMGGPGSCADDTDRVGRRLLGQSPYGVDDLAGNVWEWVADWYDPRAYEQSASRDPQGPSSGRLKVARGGCWESGADSLRVSCRKAELPVTMAYNVGFRCAYEPSAPGGA